MTFAADVPFLISGGPESTAKSPLRDDDLSEGLCCSSRPFLGLMAVLWGCRPPPHSPHSNPSRRKPTEDLLDGGVSHFRQHDMSNSWVALYK